MKKACVYILLPFFLLNSSLNELLKLPALYSHFTEHRNVDNSIDMMDFLSMHYFGDDLNDNDQDKDMELPFKKIDEHTSFQIAFNPLHKPTFEKREVIHSKKLLLLNPKDFNLAYPILGSVFRPPVI